MLVLYDLFDIMQPRTPFFNLPQNFMLNKQAKTTARLALFQKMTVLV